MSSTPSGFDPPQTQEATSAGGTSDSGSSGLGLAFVLLLLAIFSGLLGVRAFHDVRHFDQNAAPKCGSEVMSTRDRCLHSDHGDGYYDDEVRAASDKQVLDTWIRNIGLPAAGILLFLGILLIARAIRRTAKESGP